MRFERHGGVPDLQSEFRSVILGSLKGRNLDDGSRELSAQGEYPDFACFNDLMLIEMKHLEEDQTDRLNKVFDETIDPAERPLFFGERDSTLVTKNLSNAEDVNSAILSRLGRSIESLLRKSNRQFENFRKNHPRKNTVNVSVILNASIQEYSPHVVAYSIIKKAAPSKNGVDRFPAIDNVIYISEKHFQPMPDGRIAHAMVNCELLGAMRNPWKSKFTQRILDAWSLTRTGSESVRSEKIDAFRTVEDIPSKMRRHESWTLEYERNPYLMNASLSQLRVLFNRNVAMSAQNFLIGNWPRPSEDSVMTLMREFQHLVAETNRRGADIKSMSPSLMTVQEKRGAYAGLPLELVKKFLKE